MPPGVISLADPHTADVRELLLRHLEFANLHSPREDVHALDGDGLRDPALTLFGYRIGIDLLALGALKQLDSQHGELKSMHVAQAARGRGIGRAMVQHLLGVARDRRLQQVSLETGSMAAFAPARALYASVGFRPCKSYGDYAESVNSTFMTMHLPTPG